jgi:hypothetical protein
MTPRPAEIVLKLLEAAGGLPEQVFSRGQTMNWPPDMVDMAQEAYRAIGQCQDTDELDEIGRLIDTYRKRIPHSLYRGLGYVWSDNVHSRHFRGGM